MMSLTFEMANLDFAPHYGASFLHHGDEGSYLLMKRILHDEISHVSFGLSWLKKFHPQDPDLWKIYLDCIQPFLNPKRCKGFIFQEENRKKAKVPPLWIEAQKNL